MVRLIAIVMLWMVPSAGFAMIRTLPVSQLVAAADVILIAEVVSVTKETRPNSPPIRNELKVIRILKGQFHVTTFAMGTYYRPGQRGREDSLEFPAKGRKVVLFLNVRPGKPPSTVNGIQGLWPLEPGTDKTLGMGFRYSIAEVERLIAAQQK